MSEFTFHDVIPRDRAVYTASDHLMKRVRMNGRFITEALIRDLIEHGNIVGNRPGKGGWVFEKEYDGVNFRLVCDIGADLEPRIVTGLSTIVDRDAAMASDRWGEAKVQQVELRKVLSSSVNEVPADRLAEMMCPTPIDVKGHRVILPDTESEVTCVDCGMTTRSKSELAGTPCATH